VGLWCATIREKESGKMKQYYLVGCEFSAISRSYKLALTEKVGCTTADIVIDVVEGQMYDIANEVLKDDLKKMEILLRDKDVLTSAVQDYDKRLQKSEEQKNKLLNALCDLASSMAKGGK
jgi:hypothetical protein